MGKRKVNVLAVKLGNIESNIPIPTNACSNYTSKYEDILKLKVKESISLGVKFTKDASKSASLSIKSLLKTRGKSGSACKTNNWKIVTGEYNGELRVWRIK